MYTGAVAALIVFLTHPGVLVPIPAPGLLSWVRGVWQAAWVCVLHSFSEGSRNTLASLVYWGIFFVWAYLQTAIQLAQPPA